MPTIDLSILNQRQTPAFYADVFANLPAAGFVGRIFVSTDTFAFYRDNGTGWDLIGGPGTGTITGTGASGQIALWDGASTITGDTGLTYDGTDNSLTASKFIVTGGTSSDFLKGDGSLDNSAYITASALTAYVPYTGATANVNLGAFDLTADLITGATGSFTSSGGSNTFGITHTSGSGIALNISKDGNGEGLFITKGSGSGNAATINGGLVRIENNSGDAQLQIVSSSAPSVRIDNAATGATKRAGLGISTATNNFIQGSADQDFCIFNSSTTASPILFGVYDAGLTNTQEAARISPARNFILGGTVDNGSRLQVNGQGYINHNDASVLRILRNGGSDANTGIEFVNAASSAHIGSNGTLFGMGGTTGSIPAQPFIIVPSASEKIRLDANGNFGLGVTPSSWSSNYVALQFGAKGALWSNRSSSDWYLGNNELYNSSNQLVYLSNGRASEYFQFDGKHVWEVAPTGTAGNIITYNTAMVLTNNSNLLIGTTTDAGQKLQVAGSIKIDDTIQVANGDSGQAIFTNNSTAVSVSTTTALGGSFAMGGNGAFVIVYGASGSDVFIDTIIAANTGTPTVLSSTIVSGVPSLRTYSTGSNRLQLAMASGTYDVRINILRQT